MHRGRFAFAGALVLFAVLIAAGPASAYSAQYAFTITGHGWGHGVGMSQWGAYGYAKHGWDYEDILKHYYTGISLATVDNTTVRVNLRSGLSAVKLSCPYEYTVKGGGASATIAAGTTATVSHVSGGFRVVAGSLRQTFTGPPVFTPSSGCLRLVTKTDLGDDGPYRGTIRVYYAGGALMMVNCVPLESYLRGVVPHEVPFSWPAEALKTQACAARAFALGNLQPAKTWDVYCDVRDQAYAGVDIEKSATTAAVRGTAGICPFYGGKPIVATYFSSSGGRTENVKFVWGGAYPYLTAVDDRYDSYATLHTWGPLRRTPKQIDGALNANGSPRAVYTVKRGESPRIVKAAVIGSKGTTFVDGNSLRLKLGLYSTWAAITSMSISPAAKDDVTTAAGGRVTLKGRLYPALADGATVKLHYNSDGTWRSRGITTKRVAQSLSGGYTARYSTYSAAATPTRTTKYYFSNGFAKSPVTTIIVN